VSVPCGFTRARGIARGSLQDPHGPHDVQTGAADRVGVTTYPQAEAFAARNILDPPDLLDALTGVSL
jgi:hypothetical protein